MGISFSPKGRYNVMSRENECICTTLWREAGECLDGHDSCSGYIQLGPKVPELDVNNGNAVKIIAFLGLAAQVHSVELLGLPLQVVECGEILATDLLALIGAARHLPSSESGLRLDQLDRYLDSLAEMSNWSVDEGVEYVVWN